MPKLSPNSATIMEGKVVLSLRNGSAKWQARYKMGGRWICVTTKTSELNEAREIAASRIWMRRLARN